MLSRLLILERFFRIDVYDGAGALGDFKAPFCTALQIAAKIRSPGIILNYKASNNSKAYP
jgi:hypothetical protein